MRRRSRLRGAMIVGVVGVLGALAACGLDVVATGGGSGSTADAALDVSVHDGRSDALSDGPPSDAPIPVLDAGLDVNQANCLAGCDGGSCDAGWCVLDCRAQGTCTNARVACPPGIPCDVQCGQSSCTQGVDCTRASACRIACSGAGSCTNQPVQCSGQSCTIDCLGNGSCTKGVSCDAGACTIGCLGDGTCTNAPTTCNATTCTVRCGIAGDDGKESCTAGVQCVTTQLCDIGCVAKDVCRNDPITARSGGTSIVACTGEASCTNGAVLGGAGEAGVLCSGKDSCASRSYCDAGKCTAACDGEDIDFCCQGAVGVCNRTTKDCTISASGCP